MPNGFLRVWNKQEYTSPQPFRGGTAFKYILSTEVVNCAERKLAVASVAWYDDGGRELGHLPLESMRGLNFLDPPPDSPVFEQIRFVCTSARNPGSSGTQGSGSDLPQPQPYKRAGSGFVIDASGSIITNFHVVSECKQIAVLFDSGKHPAKLLVHDVRLDLALLGSQLRTSPAAVRADAVHVGETVYAAGFPLAGLLASDMNFTGGTISSLSGLVGDSTKLQITAPVQPGNTGGPLVDEAGNIAGVVVGKLDAIRVARITGDIPQNVNFAVKGDVLKLFLDANKVRYTKMGIQRKMPPVEIANKARLFSVQVICE